jgi:hypothetical protein
VAGFVARSEWSEHRAMAMASSAAAVSRASSFNRIVPLISDKLFGTIHDAFFLVNFVF